MHIGLFGGSFNPPHLAHLILAETIREQFGLDGIWWIPAYRPPHKTGRDLAAPEHRLAMTQRAADDHPAFEVLDIELRREGTSYTIDTVRALLETHPRHQFSLLLGSDSLRDFGTWHQPEAIVAAVASLMVYPRPGIESPRLAPGLAEHVRWTEAPLLEISASSIRARLHARQSIRYLVPETVRAYIREHGLYRG